MPITQVPRRLGRYVGSGLQHRCSAVGNRTNLSMLLHNYLEANAKFPSPPTSGPQSSVNSLTIDELVDTTKHPSIAFRDDTLVDSLLTALRENLQGVEINSLQEAKLSRHFTPEDSTDNAGPWKNISSEKRASQLISHVVTTLEILTPMFGTSCTQDSEHAAPGSSTKVDYCINVFQDQDIADQMERVLVEVKAPAIMDFLHTPTDANFAQYTDLRNLKEVRGTGFGQACHHIRYKTPGKAFERVISKMASYMYLSNSDWAVVTSHHKWAFLRRLHDPHVLLYSQIEQQKDNTRPFRALIAMVLAAKKQITIQPPPHDLISIAIDYDANVQRHEGNGPILGSSQTHESQSEDDKLHNNLAPQHDLEIRLLENSPVFFRAVKGTEKCSPVGQHPIRVRLVSELGRGSTAIVFGATRVDDEVQVKPKYNAFPPLTHAIKYVAKNSSQAKEKITRLRNEFETYIRLEHDQSAGYGGQSIPRCYGLFESDLSLVLLMEYAGKSVARFDDIPLEARSSLHKAVRFLHTAGVCHNDITPWNITKGDDSKYKLIDFTEATMHQCPDFCSKGGKEEPCEEIEWIKAVLPVKKEDEDDNSYLRIHR